MSVRVRSLAAIAAVLLCALTSPALAKGPFGSPVLSDKPKGGFGAQNATPTPRPTSTPARTPTATPASTATPKPTATATPLRGNKELADTGADPMRLVLAGLALLGFGLSLRFRLALGDARRPG